MRQQWLDTVLEYSVDQNAHVRLRMHHIAQDDPDWLPSRRSPPPPALDHLLRGRRAVVRGRLARVWDASSELGSAMLSAQGIAVTLMWDGYSPHSIRAEYIRMLRREFALLPSPPLMDMVHRNITFARRIVNWSPSFQHRDARSLACAMWWRWGVGNAHANNPRPTDDALLWGAQALRTRITPASPPSNVLWAGGPLALTHATPPARPDGTTPTVRFAASCDPAASYRTLDPFLGGARYQRLLREESALTNREGACRSALLERAACPLSFISPRR